MDSQHFRRASDDLPLFNTPDVQTPAPSAPGSASSAAAAAAIDGPFRRKSFRAIMLTLHARGMLSREQISAETGIPQHTLCARIAELRPLWIEAVSMALVSSAGVRVDGYRLTDAGTRRVQEST
jgi:hypothetical protein